MCMHIESLLEDVTVWDGAGVENGDLAGGGATVVAIPQRECGGCLVGTFIRTWTIS